MNPDPVTFPESIKVLAREHVRGYHSAPAVPDRDCSACAVERAAWRDKAQGTCPVCEHPAHPGDECSAPSIASEGGCDCGPCVEWLDVQWLLMGGDQPDEDASDQHWSGLPTISCSLMAGHDGPHQAKVDR